MKESYCTVSMFSESDNKKYHKNCGPTAVTNAIIALHDGAVPGNIPPEKVFSEISEIGSKMLIYWNMNRRFLGGTNDFMTPLMISSCLKKFRLNNYRVMPAFPAFKHLIDRALDRGSIILLNVHFHKKYGFHDVILYAKESGGYRTADGWVTTPQILYQEDLRFATFTEIRTI